MPILVPLIGRTAGRIEDGHFTLDDRTYQLSVDPATGHSLHGGSPGFETKKWSYQTIEDEQGGYCSLHYRKS